MIDGLWGLLVGGILTPIIAALCVIVARQGATIREMRAQFALINADLGKVLSGTDKILAQQAPVVGLAEGLLGALVKVTQQPAPYPGAPTTTQIQIQAPVDRVQTGGASFGDKAQVEGPVSGHDTNIDRGNQT